MKIINKVKFIRKIVSMSLALIVTFGVANVLSKSTLVNASPMGLFYDKSTGLIYTEFSSSVSILGYTKDVENLEIPNEIQGQSVTISAMDYYSLDDITYFVVNETLYKSGEDINSIISESDRVQVSFQENEELNQEIRTHLVSIKLPDSLTKIPSSTFKDCTSLKTINFPESLTEIEDEAFLGCYSLQEISFPENLTYISKTSFEEQIIEQYKEIEDGILYFFNFVYGYETIPNDGKVIIKDGTVNILDESFSGCEELKEIILPDTLKVIGTDAFYKCTQLSKAVIPESVIELGSSCFAWCNQELVFVTSSQAAKEYATSRKIKVESPTSTSNVSTEETTSAESIQISKEDNSDIIADNFEENSDVAVSATEQETSSVSSENQSNVSIVLSIVAVIIIAIVVVLIIISKKNKSKQ